MGIEEFIARKKEELDAYAANFDTSRTGGVVVFEPLDNFEDWNADFQDWQKAL